MQELVCIGEVRAGGEVDGCVVSGGGRGSGRVVTRTGYVVRGGRGRIIDRVVFVLFFCLLAFVFGDGDGVSGGGDCGVDGPGVGVVLL